MRISGITEVKNGIWISGRYVYNLGVTNYESRRKMYSKGYNVNTYAYPLTGSQAIPTMPHVPFTYRYPKELSERIYRSIYLGSCYTIEQDIFVGSWTDNDGFTRESIIYRVDMKFCFCKGNACNKETQETHTGNVNFNFL